MKALRVSILPLVLSVGPLFVSAAQAAECSGYDVLVNQVGETLDLGQGHTMTVVRNHSLIVSNDPAAKDHLAIGECSGTFVNLPNGTSRGSGQCLRRDKDGDTYSLEWAIAAGAEKGTFKTTGGTGKFAKIANSGWWQNAAGFGKVFATKWGGNCN
jgi:hypothetical protein